VIFIVDTTCSIRSNSNFVKDNWAADSSLSEAIIFGSGDIYIQPCRCHSGR